MVVAGGMEEEKRERAFKIIQELFQFFLNQNLERTFEIAHPLTSEAHSCRSCHDKDSALENTRGIMDCNICHFTGKVKHP